MTLFHAAILGVVEGLTEFLPVSSTGHLILAAALLDVPDTGLLTTFEIAVQLGAIAAVVVTYGRTMLVDRAVLARIAVAFVPTGIAGLALYPFVKRLLGSPSVVLWALVLGGIAIIVFELLHMEGPDAVADVRRIGYGQALAIGAFQALAIVPGVSRAGATILGGLALGIRRPAIVEFSFLLAVPTMAAAAGLDIAKNWSSFTAADAAPIAVGMLVAFLVALAAIRWLLAFVRTRTFIAFGAYRVIAAGALWLLAF
jgi:undecaprenyl-diphosphatase